MTVRMLADFSDVIHFIAAGEGMSELLDDSNSEYLDDVLEAAFKETDDRFNVEVAAAATTGGGLAHMFEWGTIGINRGRSNVRPNPTSERARLWKTEMTGGTGLKKDIHYEFQPSFAYVPKPTTRDSGMSQEVIGRLKNHVFTWKSMVMETGRGVEIEPNSAKFLLIPYRQGATGFRPNDIKRGYTLSRGPISLVPGRHVHGNFTGFWLNFWEGRGEAMMNELVEKQIESDFFPELMTNYSTSHTVPVQAVNVRTEVAAEKKSVKKKASSKAKSRRTAAQ